MEPQDRDRCDDLLDRALQHYGDVEPRAGLAGRVLASLPSPPSRTRVRWAWVLAAMTVAAVTAGVWFEAGHRQSIPQSPRAVAPPATKQEIQTAQPDPAETVRSRLRSRKSTATRTQAATNQEPKLPQFPSLRVLSRQELAMANYVERFPKEALLIAQEQRSFENEIREAEKAAGLDRPPHDSGR